MNEPLPFGRLELMDDPVPRAAALNMALDEVLLERLEDCARLRIYRWAVPAVSLGCFEPVEPVRRRWPRHDLVRRGTGGGAVEHGRDLTFSLFVPHTLPLAKLGAAESYRIIHAALAQAWARAVGCLPTLQHVAAEPIKVSNACFENPVPHDLLLAGRKVAGGAQKRTRRGLLHQGSVQQEGAPLTTLAAWLPVAFGTHVEARSIRAEEIEAAESLAASKYATGTWLHRV